ncbi:MAG TPA: uridine diphosphate-N-acetylglucosamine-binding protein YvcK [Pseudonocardiaceae bacterium]
MRAVALGGGHGLHATLSALRLLTGDVTAVVTVADDGGSSGRLRRELGMLPPGDLRMALAALADVRAPWVDVFQHRFRGDGALAGHAVGNLLLAGLVDVLGDPVAALDAAGELLGVRGRVLPMCTGPLDIEADVTGLNGDPGAVRRIRGQVAVATTPGRVQRVRLSPAEPVACEQAVRAVAEADLVVLGPGSWFTSVLPHLLVPELHRALVTCRGVRVVVLNLVPQPGETGGFSPEQHLHVLSGHAPDLTIDAVLADDDAVSTPERLSRAVRALGGRMYLDRLAAGGTRDRHDPGALAGLFRKVLTDCVMPERGGGRSSGGRSLGREEQAAWQ